MSAKIVNSCRILIDSFSLESLRLFWVVAVDSTLAIRGCFDSLSNIVVGTCDGGPERHLSIGSIGYIVAAPVGNGATTASEVIEEATATLILGVVFGSRDIDCPHKIVWLVT